MTVTYLQSLLIHFEIHFQMWYLCIFLLIEQKSLSDYFELGKIMVAVE